MSTKVTIEFDEEYEAIRALSAGDYAVALDQIQMYVRNIWKHGNISEETYKVVDEIYSEICSSIQSLPGME